jgi:hypothetical protein
LVVAPRRAAIVSHAAAALSLRMNMISEPTWMEASKRRQSHAYAIDRQRAGEV